MAQMSEETLAIIDRLKAEGQLIRNSGTNSLRSVKVELRKFDKVFDVIARNSTAQRDMLAIQTNMIEQNAERAKQEADFADLERTDKVAAVKETGDRTDKAIEKMGDRLEKISLGGMLGGAAKLGAGMLGAAAGYNVLKGFIDEKYSGSFSSLESKIGDMGKSLKDFDPKSLKTSLDAMNKNIADMNTTFKSLQEDIDNVRNSIITKILLAVASIPFSLAITMGSIRIANAIMKRNNTLLQDSEIDASKMTENQKKIIKQQADILAKNQTILDNLNKPKVVTSIDDLGSGSKFNTMDSGLGGVRTFSDAGVNTNLPPKLTTPSGPNNFNFKMTTPESPYLPNGNQKVQGGMGDGFNRTSSPMSSGRGDPRKFGELNRGAYAAANANSAPDPNAKVKPSDLNEALKKLNSPKMKKLLTKLFDFLGKLNVAFKVADLVILMAIMSESNMSEDERMAMLAGHIGGIIGAGGGMVAGGAAGLLGGPLAWITVPAGALVGSILGGFGGEAIGYYVIKYLLGEEISSAEKKAGNAKVAKILSGRQQPVGYGSARLNGQRGSVPIGHELNALDAIADQAHIYRGGSMGSYDYNATRAMKNFGIKEITPGSAGSISQSSLDIVGNAGGLSFGNSQLLINAPQTVSPFLQTVQGAKTNTEMNVLTFGGGGGEGFGAAKGLPYLLS